jgi:short-subunit dehydrogenase
MSKSVMITGASSGIGKALAYELAKKGYSLALTARSIKKLEEIRDDIAAQGNTSKIMVRQLDVTDTDDVFTAVAELTEQLGGLDIMVANAGVAVAGKVGRGEFESARQNIETNLIGAMATLDAATAHFLSKGSGHLVGISSVAGLRGMPRNSGYCASKAGIAMYLEAVRAELYRKNIDVTVLYPGYIDTPLNNMLKSRPFLISVEKGASIIARLIERKVKSKTVPVFPWNIVGRLMKILPTGIIAKM